MTEAGRVATRASFKRHPLKQIVRDVLTVGPVNRLAVAVISRLPHAEWKQRIPVSGREGVLDLRDHGSVLLGHPDVCQISMQVFWNRGRLGSAADRLALDAAIALSRSAEVFLDIGAYTGLFALAVSRCNPGIRSYAYEIVPENFLILYENVIRNDLIGRVEPRLCGLSSETGSMRVPAGLGLDLLASSIALDTRFDGGTRIPLRTLDEMHAEDQGPVVMKIDVEGFEVEILEGGKRILEAARPDMVCEVLRRARRTDELEALLRSLGYRFFHITGEGCVERKRIVPRKHERDWLFTTRGPDELGRCGLETVGSS